MKRQVLLMALALVFLLLAGTALAMSSANYHLDWFVPLTGAGGPHMASTNYAVDVTAGQSAVGASSSAGYQVRMGYWSGILVNPFFLPAVIKN